MLILIISYQFVELGKTLLSKNKFILKPVIRLTSEHESKSPGIEKRVIHTLTDSVARKKKKKQNMAFLAKSFLCASWSAAKNLHCEM